MDEFHLLLREEQIAAYSVEIWKRFRKWSGIPTGITQNVKDLLSSREVENIFENSDFVLMLNQAVSDRNILAKQLNISPQQMKYVTHSTSCPRASARRRRRAPPFPTGNTQPGRRVPFCALSSAPRQSLQYSLLRHRYVKNFTYLALICIILLISAK